MAFRGIDIRQSSGGGADRLAFRFSLKDSSGGKVTTGTTTLALYELQSDGSFKTYDFASTGSTPNQFTTAAPTTATMTLAHQTGNNGATNTGIWTGVLATLTGFTQGNIYLAQINNSGASPTDQERQFQYGLIGGDGQLDNTGYFKVSSGTGTGQINLTAGTVTLAAAGLDGIVVETGVNARQALSAAASNAGGAIAWDNAGGDWTIKALANPGTTRITVTPGAAPYARSITLNLPA